MVQVEPCPFCLLPQKMWAGETMYFMDDLLSIVMTKDLKGHKKRIMAVIHSHEDTNPFLEAYMTEQLILIGPKIFKQDFVILSDTFSRFAGHAHKIACLEDPNADDYKQVLDTERVVVHVG